MERIVFTGGGTAGHIMPNLALIPHLNDFELHYIGTPDSMEESLVLQHAPHVTFHAVAAPKLVRKLTLQTLAVPFLLSKAKREARRVLKDIAPCVIFSKGGFAALPTMLASGKIPLLLHESDFSMGLANRMGVRHAAHVCTSFSHLAQSYPNGICTGAPLRAELYRGDKKRIEAETGLCGRQNLLIMGGSLGAAAINHAVQKNLDALTRRFDIVHLTGRNSEAVQPMPHYYPLPFTDKIADYFAWADVCITRGGANALFELVALGIPSLVIPLPKGVSRGDQIDNANYFAQQNCVCVMTQSALEQSPPLLVQQLDHTVSQASSLRTACRAATNIDGTSKLVRLIRQAASAQHKP